MINKNAKIFVTGHKGLVGSAVVRRLKYFGYKNILTIDRNKLNLEDQSQVFNFFKKNKINSVINAAAKVGGIYANNKYKADFIYNNLIIQTNVIHACYQHKVQNLIFLGSSCVYPRDCKQPIKEEYLLTGKLEETNEQYAIAKISGVKMCEAYNYQHKTNYKTLMPTNLYGPNDDYDLKNSHFFAALIRKIHKIKSKNKKELIIWGSGNPKRELMYVDDLADACIFFLNKKTKETLINIGSGDERKIIDYAKFILKRISLNVKIKKDRSKPDGTPRKLLDCSIAHKYGWKSKISLEQGFDFAYSEYIKNLRY
jgi:GDP-L-fucose synthase